LERLRERSPRPLNNRMETLRLISLVLLLLAGTAQAAEVKSVRVPDGGVQPQTLVDGDGTVHLIYFKGDARGGDLFYRRMRAGEEKFSAPIQVNRQPGSSIAMGTIRGAHLALGRNGRPHVAWMGGEGARKARVADQDVTPMLYTRLADDGNSFEPERNLITQAAGLDGGGAVAADPAGNVYVTWHGSLPGNTNGEQGRAVFLAISRDDGKTFDSEKAIAPRPTGACACCGMGAFANARGEIYLMYRAAFDKINRDEILLVSRDHGKSFEMLSLDKWLVASCPMSSASLQASANGALASWETDGKVFASVIQNSPVQKTRLLAPPGGPRRKHGAAVENEKGETLFAWTEGTGWQRGGSVMWQLFTASGQAQAAPARLDGLPAWGLVAVAPRKDGSFLVIY
jgi:hypothetical protein